MKELKMDSQNRHRVASNRARFASAPALDAMAFATSVIRWLACWF
jgi:hypothetical protein